METRSSFGNLLREIRSFTGSEPWKGQPVGIGSSDDHAFLLSLPREGYSEVWTRATYSRVVSQSHTIAWNPGGYLNNAMYRIAVYVE